MAAEVIDMFLDALDEGEKIGQLAPYHPMETPTRRVEGINTYLTELQDYDPHEVITFDLCEFRNTLLLCLMHGFNTSRTLRAKGN